MSVDRREANLKTLNQAADIQAKTKESIWRTQKMAAEAEGLGTQTLQQLREQGQQMDDVQNELAGVRSKLNESERLQTQFDMWAGNWLGGKKRSAMKEAAAEIAAMNHEEHSKVKECFQQEVYFTLKQKWKPAQPSMVLCTDTSIPCPDIFDPYIQEKIENSHWTIDFSLAHLDAEGWTYSSDFKTLDKTGAGDEAPKWNSKVRRRKWKYSDKSGGAGSGVLGEIVQRQEARQEKAAASRHADKMGGGFGRAGNKPTTLTATGFSSAGMINGRRGAKDQELDDESAAGLARLEKEDAEIDAGVDSIGRTLDNLKNISDAAREELLSHNAKLEAIDTSMQSVQEQAVKVNARQRKLVNSTK